MGCYIKKYEELRKALKISNDFVIVKKGFSRFYAIPSDADFSDLLGSLDLELAQACNVDEFNETYACRESRWSMEVINQMNRSTWKRSPIEPPKTYDSLQAAIEPLTMGCYCIVRDEDVEKFDNKRSRYSTPVTEELGLAFVCKYNFDAKFKNPIEWGKCQIFFDGVPLEEVIGLQFKDDKEESESTASKHTINFTIDASSIHKALGDMAEAAKKCSARMKYDIFDYFSNIKPINIESLGLPKNSYTFTDLGTMYGTLSLPSYGTISSTGKYVDSSKTNGHLNGTWILGESDLEEAVNGVFKKTELFKKLDNIRSSYLGKPDTNLNRIAMNCKIREIFDEIEHTTVNAELIAGALCECESYPPVIVNIGSVNINSK